MKPTTRFRQLLAQPGLLVAPGAYDGLSAKLIEQGDEVLLIDRR